MAREFLEKGYAIVPVEDPDGLRRIQRTIADFAAEHLSVSRTDDATDFLNRISDHVNVEGLNALRLAVINGIRGEGWFRKTYFHLARQTLEAIVGNELAMQRGIGLNVQMPDDDSSFLPVHADVWDGDSPFEAVVWLPLVDCFRTKAMYLMPPEKDKAFQERMGRFKDGSAEDIFKAIENDVSFINIKFGEVMVFSQTLMHGNRINEEDETRWSMNCRFKSLLSPYADKKLGEFFEPITMKPASRVGIAYELPGGFNE